MNQVTPERTNWRDKEISLRHRLWGVACKATDIDFVLAEYTEKDGWIHLAALIEYKNERATPQFLSNMQYRALSKLATRADLPFFAVRYTSDWEKFTVVAANLYAERKLECNRLEMSEYEYVKFLYNLRGISDVPEDIARAIEGFQTDSRESQPTLFEE